MLDKKIPTIHSNGLNKDRLFQETNDITFALNAIKDNHEGGRISYQSEPGNELVAQLPEGYQIVGSIYGQDEEIYLFSTDGINSQIGIFKDDKYSIVVTSDCLNFNLEHPISGEYRVRNGCERTIYWCDGYNPDYWFNLDSPDDFKTLGVFDCNKFRLTPIVLPIKVDLISVNSSGGYLPLGNYYFQPEILDKNLNVIYTGDVSPQTIIYDDSQSLQYYRIDGGLNIEQYDPSIGGIPITNKSITLRFFNLNTSFSYLRINVFRQINGTQVIDGHAVNTLIPIQSESIDWTYQGYNTSNGDFPIDISEKLINNIVYQTSTVMEQVQGRLVRANLKQSNKDYSTYQSFVSKIVAKWVAKTVKGNDANYLGNSKNPQTYWSCKSFQGDEVYLPGIEFIHDDGEVSPIFPLIGKAPTVTDLELLTVVPNNAVLGPTDVWLSDVEHLGLNINDQVERWKIFNTATITNFQTSTFPYSYEGNFGYYESSENYANITNCEGEILWGDDSNDNPITNETKVRLFKFPDRRLLSHIVTDGINPWTVPLGIKFDNITYPNSTIIGHRFVYAERTEFDKTVVDSGWGVTPLSSETGNIRIGPNSDDAYRHFNYHPSNPSSKYLRFNSAETLFNKSLKSFTHYKTNRICEFDSGIKGTNAPNDYSFATLDNGRKLYSIFMHMPFIQSTIPARSHHKEEQTILVEPGSQTTQQGLIPPIQHFDYYTGDTFSFINYGLEQTTAYLPDQIIKWVRNGFVTQFKVHNFYMYKKNNINPYTNILSRNFKFINHNYISSLDTNDNEFYGGDTIIAETSTLRLTPFAKNDDLNDSYAYTPYFFHHYEEHQLISSLRHKGSDEANKYFSTGDTDGHNYTKISYLDNNKRFLRNVEDIYPEYYNINNDYSTYNLGKAKVPLPLQFNYCSKCSGYFPNRIIFSPKSFDEELFDLYKTNMINDYVDLPAHRGEITGLSYLNNQLLVHSEDTSFILQPNPQQIATDQNTAYLTTGDFLSIPPNELIQTDVGLGGCQSKQSYCNTPFGHCWVDQKRGEVFKWNGQIEILSNKGLHQWFKDYLPSELKKEYYKVTNLDFPIKSTLHDDGYGIILYYDPRFKRLILSKKDYKPIDLRETFSLTDSDHSVYSGIQGWQTRQGLNIVNIDTSNTTYFENKSWTLSYDLRDQIWISWHSYNPKHVFSDSNNYYSLIDRGIWRHSHKANYQKYFNTKYDFVIEWSNMDPNTTVLEGLYYVGYSQEYDPVNKQFITVPKTFDKLLCYNFEQSSGLQTLNLLDQHSTSPYVLGTNNISKTVIKTDQNYKIAGIYDLATSQPTMTQSWDQLKLYPGYIDAVPNNNVINISKSAYSSGNIWDKFCFIRLFFKPNEDYRKTILLQVLNLSESVR